MSDLGNLKNELKHDRNIPHSRVSIYRYIHGPVWEKNGERKASDHGGILTISNIIYS